jgi:hypothetical protein
MVTCGFAGAQPVRRELERVLDDFWLQTNVGWLTGPVSRQRMRAMIPEDRPFVV